VDSSFGVLDAFAFLVMAVLIAAGVVIVVNVGKLPGQLAHKWGHPQATAINVMSWIGILTGGLLWPVAFIWAFTRPLGIRSIVGGDTQLRSAEADAATSVTPLRKPAVDEETRP
jgi:Protein of unknown function (DUF3302)